jgi:hypothetical protein
MKIIEKMKYLYPVLYYRTPCEIPEVNMNCNCN